MEATEIDRKLSGSRFRINLDKSFAKADVAPSIILLGLYRRRNNGVDSDNRSDE